MRSLAVILMILIAAAMFACTAPQEEDEAMADIDTRLAKYAQVEVSSDVPGLHDKQKAALAKLIEAARIMDELFWKQASADGLALREKLAASDSELDQKLLHFLRINKGRFDRQANDEPFISNEPKPAGATFWPEDLSVAELEAYITEFPDEKDALYGLLTLVRREYDRLVAIPYHKAYTEDLQKAAGLLREAAELVENETLKNYLNLRAEALVTDDYLASDMAWMDLEGNMLDIVIGAIEPYEDRLMNLKAAYESFVLVKDEEAGRALEAYIEAMDAMQKALPVEEQFKRNEIRLGSSVGVFTLVYGAGDGDAGIKTIAISLPNDEQVREQKGSRKIMLRNAIQAKFENTLLPISKRLLTPADYELVDGDIFFSNILLHEIAHSFGNDFVLDAEGNSTGTKGDVALKNLSTPLEECKADIGGLYSYGVLIERGIITEDKLPSVYATFLAGVFRSVRFGAASAHGTANAIQINWLLENGGIVFDGEGHYSIDPEKFAASIESLLTELLMTQMSGDFARAEELVTKYGVLPAELKYRLAEMKDIPVDIEFVWN
ncbi:MAG TPA: Zn-dependent hydrolase [Acidobacteriota bacterium]|nr:Zn-dependent hydrolase [Acidobacteriota bacterium]